MKLEIKKHVYEMEIDGVAKRHELYETGQLALESAMDDIFEMEVCSDEMWLTKPVLLSLPIENIDYWRVWVMKGYDKMVRNRTIAIRKTPVLTRG